MSASGSTYLMVPMVIFFVLLIFAVIRGPNLISPAGIGSAVIVVAPLILATYALTIIVMAGRASVDLSIGPLIGFINVGMIQLFAAGYMESPIAFFLYAMGIGVAYQLLQGLIIIFVRVQPIIVSLSGYLTLVGLNLIVMPRPGGVAPEWMFSWGSGTNLFSAVLVILVLATILWYLLVQTAFFGHLKLMGADERAAYTSGVHINWVRLGAHAIGGLYAGLAAIAFTSLISSGDPSQGTTYTLMAVTALVLGGANLAGGRGSAFGSLLGALNIYLITYVLSTFNFGTVQSYVTDLAYGVMLVVSLLISVGVPYLQQRVRHLSPLMLFMILSVVALGVIMHTSMDKSVQPLVGVSASASAIAGASASASEIQSASSMAGQAEAGYSPGTYVLFIILGIVALVTVFRQLIRHANASMIAFVVLLAVATLGLIFNPDSADVASPLMAEKALSGDTSNVVAVTFFALETLADELTVAATISYTSQVVIAVAGIILMASVIILIMLPQVQLRTKRIALALFAAGVAIVALGALFFDSFKDGYLASTLSGEIYAVILVGVGLFTLSAPLVHSHLRNITHVFITMLGVLAFICVYFFTDPAATGVNDTQGSAESSYREPIFQSAPGSTDATDFAYPEPARISATSSHMSLYSQLTYSAFMIVLLHIFLYIAMGERTFERFWRHWEIPIFSTLLIACLFYATGVPLWQIVAVIAVAILSAPNVMHIISTYLVRQSGDVAHSKWSG